jgi:hypothetical protein
MPPVQTLLPLRLFILAWLITWITSVPLYHLHFPDTTDRWSALHSGGAHTVFTPDLAGEFSRPFKESQKAHANHLSQRIVNSPELGIALLDEKSKVKGLDILGTPYRLLEDQLLPRSVFAISEVHSKVRRFQAFPASRAPPRIVFFS